jgi:hypothetical protein
VLIFRLRFSIAIERPDQTFGEKACHPERSEGSRRPANQILRCAQDDSQNITSARSQKGLSPNVYDLIKVLDIESV